MYLIIKKINAIIPQAGEFMKNKKEKIKEKIIKEFIDEFRIQFEEPYEYEFINVESTTINKQNKKRIKKLGIHPNYKK